MPRAAKETLTTAQYRAFQEAYDFLNAELFDASLPHVLVTLQRHAKARGYFAPERFRGRVEDAAAHELAMNPDSFTGRTDEEILSTLAHEMVHLWQHHYGKPGRGRYHNRQWAERVKAVGLQPSSTGEEGGKETGDHVSDYVLPGGRFDVAVRELLTRGFAITWTEKPPEPAKNPAEGVEGQDQQQAGPGSGKRVKYTCPCCRLNAWARHNARLVCGGDDTPMVPARNKT